MIEDVGHESVAALVAMLAGDSATLGTEDAMAAHAGLGVAKLRQLFRRHYHTTPPALLAALRMERARRLLLESEQPIAEVAATVGYETLPAFNAHFRRHNRMDPQSYRRMTGAASFTLALPSWYRPARALRHLGRDKASPSESVRGQDAAFGLNHRKRPATVRLARRRDAVYGTIESGGRPQPDLAAAAHRATLRLLGLTLDPRPFERRMSADPALAPLIADQQGLTVPQTRDAFDALIWVVAGQQVSLAVAFAMRRRLIERLGQRHGAGLYAPPSPSLVATLEEDELRALGFSRRKAEYVSGIARAVVAGSLDLADSPPRSATELARTFGAVRGLGPWSVAYLLMRAFGKLDCVPVGDAALRRSLMRFFGLPARPGLEETLHLLRPFAPYRSLATFHFWTRLETDP